MLQTDGQTDGMQSQYRVLHYSALHVKNGHILCTYCTVQNNKNQLTSESSKKQFLTQLTHKGNILTLINHDFF